jgi:hypothetical protein
MKTLKEYPQKNLGKEIKAKLKESPTHKKSLKLEEEQGEGE